MDLLEKEFELLAPSLEGREVAQLHFGGGSPSFMPPALLARIMDFLKKRLRFSSEAEIAIEMNPEQVNEHLLTLLKCHGFNRVSLGVQDFDVKVQQTIGRIYPFSSLYDAVEMTRSILNVNSINLDLIYGLPFQNQDSFQATLEKTLFLHPDRVAVYPYAHVPWIRPQQRNFETEALPGPQLKSRLWCDAVETFSQRDYELIGMDHFCKESDELAIAFKNKSLHRNFMGYTTRKGLDQFAIGLTGISSVEEGYFQNHTKLSDYRKALNSGKPPIQRGYLLSPEDVLRREVIMNILVRAEVSFSEIEEEFPIDFSTHFSQSLEKLQDMERDGLVDLTSTGFKATAIGKYFLRNLAFLFDETYKAPVEGTQVYSRTV